MNKPKINNLMEYLSLFLIFSYFLIHNIFFVIIGIIISLYLININFINISVESISRNIYFKKVLKDSNKKDKPLTSESINNKLTEEVSNLTLVEKIEELGFIPSIDNNNFN